MTRLVLKAVLLGAAATLVASAAFAGVPSASNSTLGPSPNGFRLMGQSGGVPDGNSGGLITIVVRDLANNPLNNASVVIDLSNAADLRLCNNQLDANAIVNCAAKTTRKFTDITGTVQFIVLGGSNGAGNATTLLGGGRIFANGTLISSPTVAAYDLDGANGVGINDLSVWLGDFGTGQSFGRADLDLNGAVGINDLSVWLGEFGLGTSAASCAVNCP